MSKDGDVRTDLDSPLSHGQGGGNLWVRSVEEAEHLPLAEGKSLLAEDREIDFGSKIEGAKIDG